MIQVHSWCYRCERITVIESLDILPEDEEFSREMILFYHQQAEDPAKSVEDRREYESRIVEIEAHDRRRRKFLEELREIRTAERRCLKCGNTDIEFPKTQHGAFIHRPCPGQLTAPFTVAGGVMDPRYYDTPHVYDQNGKLLERGVRFSPEGSAPLPFWSDPPVDT